MEKETNVGMPTDVGYVRFREIALCNGPDRPPRAILYTLIYVFGISRAEVAEMTGLTRSRIGHYLYYGDPEPEQRQGQLYGVLKGITEAFEEKLAEIDLRPQDFEDALVPETLPVVRAMVDASRKVLADFDEAGPFDDNAEADA